MKKIIATLCLALVALAAVAQGTLAGVVVDARTRRPVAGVHIRLDRSMTGATTDGRGAFRIDGLPAGALLRFSHIGYAPLSYRPAADERNVTIRMEESHVNAAQVVVTGTGTHRRRSDTPVNVTVITAQELADAAVGTMEEALLKLDPSFAKTPLGSMGDVFTMNGLDDSYTLFMVNGQRLLGSGSSGPDLSRIDIQNIKRIEILDGAASTLYGSDAIAGVVNVITDELRSGVELSTRLSCKDHGRYDHSVNLDAKEGRLGTYTSFSHQQAGGWLLNPMIENKKGELEPADKLASLPYASNSVSQRFTYDLTDRLSVYAAGSWYGYAQDRPWEVNGARSSYAYDMLHRNYTYGAGMKYIAREGISLFADFYSDNYASRYRYFDDSGDFEAGDESTRIATRLYQATLKGIFDLGGRNRLTAGAEYLTDCLDEYASATLADPVSKYTLSLYAQDEVKIHRNLLAVAGVRYLYHERFGSHATPNVALMYRTGGFRARASFATGYKTPTLYDTYTYNVNQRGDLTIGNEELRPEKSAYASLGLEYTGHRVSVSATGYWNRLRDKIDIETFEVSEAELLEYQKLYGPEVTSNLIKKRTNLDRARVAGLSLAAKYYVGAGLTLSAAYNFTDGRNLSADEGADDRLDKNVRHAGNVAARWNRTWGRYRLDIDFAGQIRGRRFSSTYSPRIGDAPRYSLWDLNTRHTFTLGRVILTPGFGVENLFGFVDDRPSYRYYVDAKGKGASSMSPYATLTPGRTFYFSFEMRLRSK